MVRCSHETCGSDKRIWIPETSISSDSLRSVSSTGCSDISLHHWCIHCGCIQNKADDPPKKMGYWINILTKIAREYHLTQVQKRLVVKGLESNEFFEDIYAIAGSVQKKIFVNIVKKYSNLNEITINSCIF